MFIIGELINGMFKKVESAIEERDPSVIETLALDQVNAGAHALDVNVGPHSKDPVKDICWLIEAILKAAPGIALCLDSTRPAAIETGLKLIKGRSIINSTDASDEKLSVILPMAKRFKAGVIGLTMDRTGVPRDRNQRLELAAKLLSACAEHGIGTADLYIDPVILPVNVAQPQAAEVIETIRDLMVISDPPPQTIIGLSNVSQGTKSRNLINRTMLVMAASNGLSAAILNPLDRELMDALATAELLLNRNIYCDSYLARKG